MVLGDIRFKHLISDFGSGLGTPICFRCVVVVINRMVV
jgi:hypothetical protein